MLYSFNLTEQINKDDIETCSSKLISADTVQQATEHILDWLQTMYDFSRDIVTYFSNALDIDDGMGLKIKVTNLKQTTKLEFVRTMLDDHTIPTKQKAPKPEEISILATITRIDNDTEVYTDILAVYTDLNYAEFVRQCLDDMSDEAIKDAFNIDMNTLQDYDELVIFQLPLSKTPEALF